MERVLSEADSQPVRNGSLCQASETSQTAAEYVSYLTPSLLGLVASFRLFKADM